MSLIGPTSQTVEPPASQAGAAYDGYPAMPTRPIDRPMDRPITGPAPSVRGRHRRRRGGKFDAEPATPVAARVAVFVGKSLVVAGILLLLFALFQLWGTGIAEARAQQQLNARFQSQQADAVDETVDTNTPEKTTVVVDTAETSEPVPAPPEPTPVAAPAPAPAPAPGDPVAMLSIPAIDVTKTVVEGTSRDVLRSGPGHYRFTPLPGQPGNIAVAGHRTTHGAPFFDIDLLQPGDEIYVETVTGTLTYLVQGFDDGTGQQIGHRIVQPEDVGVIADHGDNRLTLTACHPKYSAKQRIVVTAILGPDQSLPGPPASPPASADPATAADGSTTPTTPSIPTSADLPDPADPAAVAVPPQQSPGRPGGGAVGAGDDGIAVARSLGWQRHHAGATALWAALTAMIATAGALVGRYWRRWPAYAMTVPPFGLALFHCFTVLERLLPAM